LDEAEKNRVVVSFSGKIGGGVHLFGQDGKTHATLGSRTEGSTGLQLKDKTGRIRVGLFVYRDGTPAIVLFDENGEVRAELGSTSLETTRLTKRERSSGAHRRNKF